MKLHLSPTLRRTLIPLMARVNLGDVTIRHSYTKDPLLIHSFRHRGYWYQPKRREEHSMSRFNELVEPGSTVIEVGGHVGFITLYFAHLVGRNGRVVVLEPGQNNLPYLRRNLEEKGNVELVAAAAADRDGEAMFFLEDLSGQNNTLIGDYEGLEENSRSANVKRRYQPTVVPTIRLDSLAETRSINPGFIKIDVEGAEFDVLQGSIGILREKTPALMVEVTRREVEVGRLLNDLGYMLFSECRDPVEGKLTGNIFALHVERHGDSISSWLC